MFEQKVPAGLNNLANTIFHVNRAKGFYETDRNIGEMLCLIHSEISEALEADRKKSYSLFSDLNFLNSIKKDADFTSEYENSVKGGFEEEMADIIIRVLDLCGYKNIDIEGHLKAKLRYNKLRGFKHGKLY